MRRRVGIMGGNEWVETEGRLRSAFRELVGDKPRVALVLVEPPEEMPGVWTAKEREATVAMLVGQLEAFGAHADALVLRSREQATDEAAARIRNTDWVHLWALTPDIAIDALRGTPLDREIRAAIDRGALVTGMGTGATVLGAATVSVPTVMIGMLSAALSGQLAAAMGDGGNDNGNDNGGMPMPTLPIIEGLGILPILSFPYFDKVGQWVAPMLPTAKDASGPTFLGVDTKTLLVSDGRHCSVYGDGFVTVIVPGGATKRYLHGETFDLEG